MQAVRLTAWERPARLVEVPVPEPRPGEVLVRVAAAGLCHSDLHLMHWPAGALPYELPFTLGHEIAGTVAALGPGAEGLEPGEPVLVYGPWGCGGCHSCSVGAEHLCERPPTARGAGLGRDGGLADYVVVPSPRLTVPLDGLDPVAAAPLADAGLTPYHAIRRALGLLRPGTSAIVIGVGGLGHVAVQLLKALGPSRVVAVDRRDEALEVATRGGADAALQAAGLTPLELRRAAGARGAALVLDCVGSDETLSLAAGAVAPGGHVSLLGLAGGRFPMHFGGVPLETSVIFSNWGTRSELAEVVELARDGAVSMEIERISLAEVPEAYERLAAGGGRGRLVAVPDREPAS
ncbi:MAG TPA: NAD(P)-dependent alcohol dehydrogenase [Solirubrobacteraceae bacterium]|nr:NAD(P)-dependent alcohol dehydrogenase [Solirubrobacteraceae bacterium]